MQRSETHYDHWSALGYDGKATREALARLLHHGTSEQRAARVGSDGTRLKVHSVCHPAGGGTRLMALLAAPEPDGPPAFGSAYPVLAGSANTLTVEQASPWSNGMEGFLRLSTLSGTPFWAFDTHYYRHKSAYVPGARLRFAVAGLALGLRYAPLQTLVPGNAMLPGSHLGDSQLQAQVTAVEETLLDGRSLLRLPIALLFDDGALTLKLYAAPGVCAGYRPAPGDYIRALAWMQVHRIGS
ncbi:MAG: hypothetical protein ACYC5O_03205 [Anaerolineae bacterium]